MVPSYGRIAVRARPSRRMAAAAVLAFMVPGMQTCRTGLKKVVTKTYDLLLVLAVVCSSYAGMIMVIL